MKYTQLHSFIMKIKIHAHHFSTKSFDATVATFLMCEEPVHAATIVHLAFKANTTRLSSHIKYTQYVYDNASNVTNNKVNAKTSIDITLPRLSTLLPSDPKDNHFPFTKIRSSTQQPIHQSNPTPCACIWTSIRNLHFS